MDILAIIETILSFVCSSGFDKLISGKIDAVEPSGNIKIWGFISFVVGALVGGLSLIVFHHSFLTSIEIRSTNLVVTPIISGLISKKLAELKAGENIDTIASRHFWCSYFFVFGVLLVRYFS